MIVKRNDGNNIIDFTVKAPAKLNLTLDISGKRSDGFHLLRSYFHTVALADDILVKIETCRGDSLPSETFRANRQETIKDKNTYGINLLIGDELWLIGLQVRGEFAVPASGNNTIIKVFRELADRLRSDNEHSLLEATKYVRRCRIELTKNIPNEAGLGGGSSDAAALIEVLANLKTENSQSTFLPSSAVKKELATAIGMDVPFFLTGGMAEITGAGETVRQIEKTTELPVIIFKPETGISTAIAYKIYDQLNADETSPYRPDNDKFIKNWLEADYGKALLYSGNAFEAILKLVMPEYIQLLSYIRQQTDSASAHLSGSGSAGWIIPSDHKKCESILCALNKKKVWCKLTNLQKRI